MKPLLEVHLNIKHADLTSNKYHKIQWYLQAIALLSKIVEDLVKELAEDE